MMEIILFFVFYAMLTQVLSTISALESSVYLGLRIIILRGLIWAFTHSTFSLAILECVEILCTHLFIHSSMQPLFIESNLVRDTVIGAEGTAMKWKDKVFILVIDETGRSKQGWDWTSDFI